MKILVTGSAGRVGRAIYIKLAKHHEVVGLDRIACSTADFIGDLRDTDLLEQALNGVEVVVHTAALHAPHVGLVSDQEFEAINILATQQLAELALQNGVKHFVFTSTTALYGFASTPAGYAGWVNETVSPQPKSIYHRTKIAAEQWLQGFAEQTGMAVTILQMSRCFPEPVDLMMVYRLTRGIDARDVANAHLYAIEKRLPGFERFIVSGKTPFKPSDCEALYSNASELIKTYQPELADIFMQRKWQLPNRLDRVYDSSKAQKLLGWQPKYGFDNVLAMYDEDFAEVLPVKT